MAELQAIHGIGDDLVERLLEANVNNTEALAERGSTPERRRELAEEIDVDPDRLLYFVKQADLMRVRGIGGEYAEVLVAAGVDSVGDLAQRDPKELYEEMAAANARQEMVETFTDAELRAWIERAKALPEIMELG